MARKLILAAVGVLFLSMGAVQASPMDGQFREQYRDEIKRRPLQAGKSHEFSLAFKGNQRACVIVEGDHKERGANLSLKVFDSANNLVASDGGGDCVAVLWYPPQVQRYRVVVQNNGTGVNELDIVLK